MTDDLRVALLVEGSLDIGKRQDVSWLSQIWNERLVELVQHAPFQIVVPISKKDLIAMEDPSHRPTGSEPIDMKLCRLGAGDTFDAAIVAWDLHPRWNPNGRFCRWEETCQLMDCLARSDVLPTEWQMACSARAREYRDRESASYRQGPPALEKGAVLPLCMDPEFEDLLAVDEVALLRVLGLDRRPAGWPSGWGQAATRRPAEDLLRLAVQCVPRNSPLRRRLRGCWRTNKNEWGEYLLRRLMAEERARGRMRSHPIAQRLAELA